MRHITSFMTSVLLLSLVTPTAKGIYNADPPISNDKWPAAGMVHLHTTGRMISSGVLIESNLSSGNRWVLCAGHTATNATDIGFTPKGWGETRIEESAVYIHPYFKAGTGLTVDNDLALIRLREISTVVPAVLSRDRADAGSDFDKYAVGFGAPQKDPSKILKREGYFEIDQSNDYKFLCLQPPPMAAAVIGGGDSGGPWFTKKRVFGITESSGNKRSAGTYVYPYLDWIDSYTRKTVFWDNLYVRQDGHGDETAVQIDTFKDTFDKGLGKGWQEADLTGNPHPQLGEVKPSSKWRFIEAISFDNDDDGGDSGCQGCVMQSGGASVIKKSFPVNDWLERWVPGTRLEICVAQRWNSLGLWDDMGLQINDGPIEWDFLSASQESDLDAWFYRRISFNANRNDTVTVYLVNSTTNIPEPTCMTLLIMGVLVPILRRRR